VPKRTEPRKWRKVANSLQEVIPPPKKSSYLIIGSSGIENLDNEENPFNFSSIRNEPILKDSAPIKGGLGDMLLELYTPDNSPPGTPKGNIKKAKGNSDILQDNQTMYELELRAKAELQAYLLTVNSVTAETLKRINWELLGVNKPPGPAPAYENPPID